MKNIIALYANETVKVILDNPLVSSVLAVITVLFELIYGTHDLVKFGMTLLIILVAIDWLSGFSAAKKDLIDTSSYGIEGLRRTMVLLMIPAAAHFIDLFFMTQGLASYFMIAALARHLTKSIAANIVRVGWTQWIPAMALQRLLDWVSDEIASKETRAQKRFDSIYKEDDE